MDLIRKYTSKNLKAIPTLFNCCWWTDGGHANDETCDEWKAMQNKYENDNEKP